MRQFSQIACQLSFYPLNESNIDLSIAKVLKMIDESGLSAETGSMSTVIRGDSDMVFTLLRKITTIMSNDGCQFSMNIVVSNICGCD